jgi:hypothetical protein
LQQPNLAFRHAILMVGIDACKRKVLPLLAESKDPLFGLENAIVVSMVSFECTLRCSEYFLKASLPLRVSSAVAVLWR